MQENRSIANILESVSFDDERSLSQFVKTLSAWDIQHNHSEALALYELFLKKTYPNFVAPQGDFYTPQAVMQLMVEILNLHGGQIYDPCCGSGSLLIMAAQKLLRKNVEFSLYGQILDRKNLQICKTNFSLHNLRVNLGNAEVRALETDAFPFKKFDYILSNPPFNCSTRSENTWHINDQRWIYGPPPRFNANFAWLQHVIYHLNKNGCAAILMPNSTLTSVNCREAEIRRNIVSSGILEAIVTFPKNIFSSTEIPFCLWLITKKDRPHKNVLFIDATRLVPKIQKELLPTHIIYISEILTAYRREATTCRTYTHAIATPADIAKRNYILSPNLYIQSSFRIPIKNDESAFLTMLQKLCDMDISENLKQHLRQWVEPPVVTRWFKQPLLELYMPSTGIQKQKSAFNCESGGISLLDTKAVVHHSFVPSTLARSVSITQDEFMKYRIRGGDVFMNRTSETTNALACCCVAVEDRDAVYGGYLKRLRPYVPSKIYPHYAAGYFRSSVFRKQVSDTSTVYTTRASLNNQQLSKIWLYYPDKDMQYKLGNTLYAIFLELERCENREQHIVLEQFYTTLIERFITYLITKNFEIEDVDYD